MSCFRPVKYEEAKYTKGALIATIKGLEARCEMLAKSLDAAEAEKRGLENALKIVTTAAVRGG